MGMILNALGALAIGAVGWITLEFFGRPVRSFYDLQRSVRAQMSRLENLGFMMLYVDDDVVPSIPEANKVLATLRDLSAELISFGQSEWLAAKFIRLRGFEPTVAGEFLANLALDHKVTRRSENYRKILKALKYPVA
jgi:hypothetical protein